MFFLCGVCWVRQEKQVAVLAVTTGTHTRKGRVLGLPFLVDPQRIVVAIELGVRLFDDVGPQAGACVCVFVYSRGKEGAR